MADPRVTTSVDTAMDSATLRPAVAWAAIFAMVILAVVRSAIATRTDGFTIDDAYHITAGVSHVKLRDFRLKAEEMFRDVLAINPKSFGALLHLGNLKLRRGDRGEALHFYERARDQLTEEDLVMRELLTKQIERLSSNEPLDRIPP